MNDLSLAWSMLTSPVAAFAELRTRPRFWFPLLMLTLATVALYFWYYSVIDIEWLKDRAMSGNARFQALPEETRGKILAAMTRNAMRWPTVIGVAILIPLAMTLVAGYNLLAGKIVNFQQSFKHWFALNCWCSLPMLLGIVGSMLMLLARGNNLQIDAADLQILSLNDLFQLAPGAQGYQLAASLTLFNLWSLGLSIIGIRSWSNRSWTFSAVFVLLPVAVIFGIWAMFAFKG